MDKFDFINRIIALYPHAITDKQAQYDTYNRALNKNKIDFEKLMDVFAEEYKDSFPPPAAVLKDMAQKCLKEEIESGKTFQEVKVYDPIHNCIRLKDVFPKGTSKERMIKTYEKMFPGSSGWQIIEVW